MNMPFLPFLPFLPFPGTQTPDRSRYGVPAVGGTRGIFESLPPPHRERAESTASANRARSEGLKKGTEAPRRSSHEERREPADQRHADKRLAAGVPTSPTSKRPETSALVPCGMHAFASYSTNSHASDAGRERRSILIWPGATSGEPLTNSAAATSQRVSHPTPTLESQCSGHVYRSNRSATHPDDADPDREPLERGFRERERDDDGGDSRTHRPKEHPMTPADLSTFLAAARDKREVRLTVRDCWIYATPLAVETRRVLVRVRGERQPSHIALSELSEVAPCAR